jgi:hypothetical protein
MSMMQKYLFGLIALVALPAMSGAAANQSIKHVVGDAFGLKSNDLIYRETHCGIQDELASEVFYQNRDGTLIAHKELDYKSGHTTPSLVQHNFQAGEKIQVSFDQQAVSMSVTDHDNQESKNTYPVTDTASKPIVIDAGFDGFIRDNWDKLVSGETQEFQFPLASRSSLVSLRVKPSVCSYQTETDQCFTLEPSNWFFRMLASPIELGYDSNLARLTRYRGLSNINDESGKGLIVDIKYRYQAIAGTACNIDRLVLRDDTTNL